MNGPIHIPSKGPPRGPGPSKQIYAAMGESGIFNMLADFYRLLGRSTVRHLFPRTEEALVEASRKSAAYFVQITGGPPLFNQQHGPPKLRERHLRFRIDKAGAKEWLRCFFEILSDAPEKYNFPVEHLEAFQAWLTQLAEWMVNTDENAPDETDRSSP